ncbi:MAG: phenylalanine--tRNA ligase subunit alpha, partial [Rhizobiaceae bacterium]
MSDIETLENDILAQIGSAADQAALEQVRVSALGKKGSVSEQMKTLGKMSPEERQIMGPALNGLKARIA